MATEDRNTSDSTKCFRYQIDIFDNFLGHGGFGTVYKGQNDAGTNFAIKRVSKTNKRNASTEAVKAHFLKEKINHDHVVKVYDVRNWKDSMWIVMEYCDLGDLNNFFEKFQRNLATKSRVNIMCQISKGIAFLHDKNIVHRDIKPGNILLKRQDTCAIVKLGDFGLSKILDPDDITSAMSSNVGTLTFKAPEFWDQQPGERVRYHRNVDIYAAGLTFAAMLQAKPGHSLVPKAECSLQPSETKMPIGLAAFTRYEKKHNEINVVVQDRKDTSVVKKLKSIIETMTCLSPDARTAASEVEKRLDILKREVKIEVILLFRQFDEEKYMSIAINTMISIMFQFSAVKPNIPIRTTSQFNITEENKSILLSNICYVKDKIVASIKLTEASIHKIKVYDERSTLVKEWESCHFKKPLMGFEAQAKEYLLEGCPLCQMIRGYEFPQIESKILCKGISFDAMCKGPDCTILFFKQNSLKQLRFCDGQFLLEKEFSIECEGVHSLCFSENCGLVIALHDHRQTLTGFHFPSGQVAWQHKEIQSESSSQVATDFRSILVLPDRRVCVFTPEEVIAINPVNGTFLYTLHRFHESIFTWASATCYNGNQQKMATTTVRGTVFAYNVPFEPLEGPSFLPWKDIVGDEETMETS